ncbi:hypothetical protein [Mucilaginibacter phyllosphaerae]|uniref:Uncharacterized protein n=1 Tax=Mucilaginibacter phyllosphaerae TaxID=1812349 RepID=A0A4Y8AB64_9SPHI|nr:hypothetical protein [Mucilaginibacter phyllosphaerae]MBB3969782.1 hypothetical protein [Mucilaginibacter phyllosphaerae]TEW65162.1 hypothetical protein E2R65_14705 [Mucilaginibacter phyllosphaerae]GGH17564.1 hypothetical protein GCM10007352_27780 [Mucilaginibacter phyllosphaerae]
MKKILTLLVMAVAFNYASAQTDTASIGKTMKVQTTVCHIDVSWNGRSGINNVYAAPSGWQILSFTPKVVSRRQRVSFTFSQTPSNFVYTSTSVIDSKFNELLELAAQKNAAQKYEGRINQMRSDYEKYYSKVVTTHSQITTTGSVRGNNEYFSRRPGRLYLDLEVTLVYMPDTQEQFLRSLEYLKQVINSEG